MIEVNRVLFLVDGLTEIRSFRDKFIKDYNVKVSLRKVECNGKNVTPEGYANKAIPIIQMCWGDQFNHFFCVIDLESRRMKPENFANSVHSALQKKMMHQGINATLSVVVPNRMFENWIVSDVEGIKDDNELVKQIAQQDYFDGKVGSKVLANMMTVPYKKTSHGPRLFKRTDFTHSKSFSPSFMQFADALMI